MISFKQYLHENQDFPLYHGTSTYNAHQILKDNEMKSFNDWWINGKLVDVISTTRSLNFAKWWTTPGNMKRTKFSSVIFQFNREKLKQRYKISPLNFFGDDESALMYTKQGIARARYGNDPYLNQFEECIITKKISNINLYIEKVIVSSLTNITPTIRQHPKLFFNGGYVNA